MKKLYLAVTPDEFELPLFVADTAKELGDHYGVTANVISSSISHQKNGRTSGRKFIRVEIDEE